MSEVGGGASALKVLRGFLHRKPFHAFRLVTRSGDHYEVTNPETVAIGLSNIYVHSSRMTVICAVDVELIYEPRKVR